MCCFRFERASVLASMRNVLGRPELWVHHPDIAIGRCHKLSLVSGMEMGMEWKWDGNGMGMKRNGNGMEMEWKWKGNGMECFCGLESTRAAGYGAGWYRLSTALVCRVSRSNGQAFECALSMLSKNLHLAGMSSTVCHDSPHPPPSTIHLSKPVDPLAKHPQHTSHPSTMY